MDLEMKKAIAKKKLQYKPIAEEYESMKSIDPDAGEKRIGSIVDPNKDPMMGVDKGMMESEMQKRVMKLKMKKQGM